MDSRKFKTEYIRSSANRQVETGRQLIKFVGLTKFGKLNVYKTGT